MGDKAKPSMLGSGLARGAGRAIKSRAQRIEEAVSGAQGKKPKGRFKTGRRTN